VFKKLIVIFVVSSCDLCMLCRAGSAEVELSSLKQRLDESTAVSQALRLELQLHQHIALTNDDDKENNRGIIIIIIIIK